MALPEAVAVDRPLKLGTTMERETEDGYYTLKLDFEPESLQQAEQADLLLLHDEQLKLVPVLPDGDCPFHYDGKLEQLHQKTGGDIECVAYFDGSEWTLELVQAHLRAKHRPGAPHVPGYNVDVPEGAYDPSQAAVEQRGQVAAVQQQLSAASLQQNPTTAAAPAEHEIDPDLDDALEEALFAADRTSSQAPPSNVDQQQAISTGAAPQQQHPAPEAAAPVKQMQPHIPSHPQPQQSQPAVPQQPQQQQQQQQPAQQQPAAAADDDDDDSADEESDDPWDTFDAAAAPAPAPTVPKPAVGSMPVHPAAAAAPAPAAAAAAVRPAAPARMQPASAVAASAVVGGGEPRGAVSVLGGDEDEEEDAGPGVQECSEDESDGVGVEYF